MVRLYSRNIENKDNGSGLDLFFLFNYKSGSELFENTDPDPQHCTIVYSSRRVQRIKGIYIMQIKGLGKHVIARGSDPDPVLTYQ